MEDLGKRIKELSDSINSEMLENATDEELLHYMFLTDKLKYKLEQLVKLGENAENAEEDKKEEENKEEN